MRLGLLIFKGGVSYTHCFEFPSLHFLIDIYLT